MGDGAQGVASSACAPDAAGTLPLGQICSLDGGYSWASQACASNHCDLMPWPGSTVLTCAPLCRAEADCGPAQECGVVIYAPATNPRTVPFHPAFTQATHDAVTACFTPPIVGGAGVEGTPCTDPSQCRGYKCLHLVPGDPQRYCSAFCTTDAQCPAGMACKLDTLTLASEWLQSTTIDTQPPLPSAWTIVRVCKFAGE